MIEILFFNALCIGKCIYEERVDFDYSYGYSFNGYSIMLLNIFYSFVGTSVNFNDRFMLPSPVPFLAIYDIDAKRQNFSESYSFSIEYGNKARYNLSFIGHYTSGNKSPFSYKTK